MREALSVKKWLAPMVVAILTLVCVQAHATLGMLGGAPSGSVSPSTWFGATLPTAPTTFTTSSSPPAAGSTCNGSYFTPSTGAALQTALNSAAANTCANGDVIELTAGTTYTSTAYFTLPTHSGGWIYIISSAAPEISGSGLPAAGTRICIPATIAANDGCTTNTAFSDMASLRSSCTSCNGYILERASAASNYRLVGIDIESVDSNSTTPNGTVEFNNGDTATSTLAAHITFDRCFISGAPTNGVIHALTIDGTYIEITESDIENVWEVGNGDTQAILGYNGTGPYKITDNFLMAMGETTLFGGADTSLPSPDMSSDIDIENNHYFKPIALGATGSLTNTSTTLTITLGAGQLLYPTMILEDENGNPPPGIPAGTTIVSQLSGTTGKSGTYQMSAAATANETSETINAVSNGKNAFEFKMAERALVNHNFFENAGALGQSRSATTLTVRNQSGTNPWSTVSDITYTNNIFTNGNFGLIDTLLQDNNYSGNYATQPSYRILWRNNLYLIADNSDGGILLSSNGAPMSGAGGQGGHVVFDHNTFVFLNSASYFVYMTTSVLANLNNVVFSNNIIDTTAYEFHGDTASGFTGVVGANCTQPAFTNNVVIAGMETYPSGNFLPAARSSVDFTSYGSATAAAGYALTGASPYHAAGVSGLGLAYNASGTPDSTDIGVNISALPAN